MCVNNLLVYGLYMIYELSNMVCEPQSCEPDNEHVEASMEFTEIPIKKRRHFKSDVEAEIPLTCENYYSVLTEGSDVPQILFSESNLSKGQSPSNKLQQQYISELKVTRKRKTVGLNVTTKKKAKLNSTNVNNDNSEINNEMLIDSQPFVV